MDSLKLATIATHVAASITMVLHPASHTHRQMNDEQLVEAGVSPGMIRLSIGIENVDDIIKDLDQATVKNALNNQIQKGRIHLLMHDVSFLFMIYFLLLSIMAFPQITCILF